MTLKTACPKPEPSAPKTPKRPNRKNVKRAKANHERAYGEKAEWIRQQNCCACGIDGRSEAAHVGGGGTGYKGDSTMLVPLCGKQPKFPNDPKRYGWYVEGCHAASHRIGVKTFERKYNVDLKAKAAEYEQKWQSFGGDDHAD